MIHSGSLFGSVWLIKTGFARPPAMPAVKYGDTQMTAMGMLGSISFMSVSRSKPLDRLSNVRPLTSIFHPALFISLLGQFTIHLITMMIAVYYAKKNLPSDYDPP